ncbi:hypothetical protein EDB87DRAFT_1574790 [Lactarius vividus]|nr:hypothetical protein EDB87DRAFT_1574790 [Lactarius vividus]
MPGSAVADIRKSLGIAFIGQLINVTGPEFWRCRKSGPYFVGLERTQTLGTPYLHKHLHHGPHAVIGAALQMFVRSFYARQVYIGHNLVSTSEPEYYLPERHRGISCHFLIPRNACKLRVLVSVAKKFNSILYQFKFADETDRSSLLGTATIVNHVVSPSSMIWLAFCWVMGQCCVNSMVALLNSRDWIRERTSSDKAFSLSSI